MSNTKHKQIKNELANYGDGTHRVIVDETGLFVCDCGNYNDHKSTQFAERIARCWNSHDELVEALTNGLDDMIQWRDYLNDQIESFDGNERSMMVRNYNDACDRVSKAIAAIKKATE